MTLQFKAALLATISMTLCLLTACTGVQKPPASIHAGARHITLDLVPGRAYRTTTWWLIFPVPIYPQVACWLETPAGDYIDTIYVTAKGAKKSWVSAPAAGRPEALPVWTAVIERHGAQLDAVSSPTPSGKTAHATALGTELAAGTYIVKLEVNRSYDYNNRYTRANSGVTGQPSIIYQCAIDVGGKASRGVFVPVGTGSVDGSDGEVHAGIDGITTALEILSAAEIRYGESAER